MQHVQSSSRTASKRVVVFALMSGSLVNCNCEDIVFRAAAKYTPESVLNFGEVAVTSEKKLDIVVLNEGTAGLRILEPNVAMNPDKWRVTTMPDLLTGITPGRTSSISVTYRPCPDAWERRDIGGKMVDILKEGFDYSTCMTDAAESTDLNVVELDTLDGGQRITLSGIPVQPPNATVFCQNGVMACNANNPMVDPCNAMTFGGVTGGETPCDMVVEVRDTFLNQKAVGELHIEGISIQVQNIEDELTVDGPTAGFTVHNLDGSALNPDPANPFVIAVPAGMMDGRERFLIRFSGIASGTWDGRAQRSMTGVKLYTNDPAHPVLTFAINGTGSAPDIDWQPTYLNFGSVPVGVTKTLTATITNSGDADLRITSIGFAVDTAGAEFSYTTDRAMNFPIVILPADRMHIHVHYRPTQVGRDSDRLVIINNDIKENNRIEIPTTGGPVPILRVDPPDVLLFPLSMNVMNRREQVLLSNVGSGDLEIQRLTITGPQSEPTHPSADDFSFGDGCENPCNRSVTLCSPEVPGCSPNNQTAVPIVYLNNDISNIDYAELHIFTTDPADPEHVVVLSAEDNPCLFPTPQITYEPSQPCKGEPVTASAATSIGGGPNGTGGIIVSYAWEWLFTPAASPPFAPPDGVMTTFIPTDSGVYVLGLKVKNDCGSESPTPATETLMVAETCN